MVKRLTPIERAIAGEPIDRQQRYRRNVVKRGLVRVTVMVPNERAHELRSLARSWREERTRRDD